MLKTNFSNGGTLLLLIVYCLEAEMNKPLERALSFIEHVIVSRQTPCGYSKIK